MFPMVFFNPKLEPAQFGIEKRHSFLLRRWKILEAGGNGDNRKFEKNSEKFILFIRPTRKTPSFRTVI